MEAAEQEPLMFDDVAVYFTHEEWGSLEEWQKELYKEVMVENYHTLCSLGIPVVKSELLLLIEGGEEPCVQGQPRWEDLRYQPQAAPDGRSRRAAEEGSAVYGRIWRDQRPLTYGRRSVRKRCGRRSPNFSRVELECFVSLMDRYLPDELQRTGAISLRQRRSILQEIARCLEPMSGCLRTPRQLLHRWADFNNRDPERLMQIRMQLHFAGNGDRSCESSDVETAPSMGKRWRRRTSRPLSSSSSSSCSSEEEEEPQGDPLDAVWDEGHSAPSPQYFPNSQMSVTTHIDAQGRYVVPPPPPDPGQRWWQRCSGEWVEEEQSDLQGSPVPVERSPKRATSTLYSSLQEDGDPVMELDPETHAGAADPGLRTIKMEPDSEEDEGDTPGARCIKRSPNFSPAELECFVALMDHFLPGNLIRAGAIPIRQRKAILQEIARRLEPLSGCLRTPRQLRHRWTDFNNRDPDRLEEIRRRLRRAARQGSGRPPAKTMESPSTAGKSWRPRRSRPLPRAIKEEECPPEQMRLETSEEHRPRTPWHHHGLPKPRNSFSMARLKKNRHLALHILRMERLLRRVDKRQELLLEQADLSEDECADLKPGQISM